MLRSRGALQLVGLALSACLIALLLGSFASATAATWSGTWSRAEDGVSGNLILTQSGANVSGHYTWGDGSGTVGGTVSGATFSGAFNETHYQGSFVLTIAGQTFTGSYTGHNKDTGGDISGPFDGSCIAGDCLQNGAAPPPPPTPTPPGAGISGLTGKVEVQLEDGAWQPATTAIKLTPGTKIHTGFKAGATLTFPDGSTLAVKPMSLVIVQSIDSNGNVVFLQLGEVKATVHRNGLEGGDSFETRSPTSAASDRGTVYSVLYDGTTTIVSVITDSVVVTPNHGASVTVPAGKEVSSTASSVSHPVPIGTAGAPAGSVGPEKATALVNSAIAAGLAKCKTDAYSITLKPRTKGWLATVKLVGSHPGTGTWTITGKKVAPTNALAKKIAAGCKTQ